MSVFGIISFAFGGGNRSITDEQIERQKRKAIEQENLFIQQHLRQIEEQKKAQYYQSIQRNQQANIHKVFGGGFKQPKRIKRKPKLIGYDMWNRPVYR